jgi:hypothetical protein
LKKKKFEKKKKGPAMFGRRRPLPKERCVGVIRSVTLRGFLPFAHEAEPSSLPPLIHFIIRLKDGSTFYKSEKRALSYHPDFMPISISERAQQLTDTSLTVRRKNIYKKRLHFIYNLI